MLICDNISAKKVHKSFTKYFLKACTSKLSNVCYSHQHPFCSSSGVQKPGVLGRRDPATGSGLTPDYPKPTLRTLSSSPPWLFNSGHIACSCLARFVFLCFFRKEAFFRMFFSTSPNFLQASFRQPKIKLKMTEETNNLQVKLG